MKIYAYVDGQLKFNFNINVPYEKLNQSRLTYLGLKGSQELLAVYKEIEKKLNTIYSPIENSPSLEQLDLDEMNLNEYLQQKFPDLEQLELRADDDSYFSPIKNLFGKQCGYPLVWLNCNKYIHSVFFETLNHPWELCIYGKKLNSLDIIGSLTKYFKNSDESTYYQGTYNAWLSSVKNSFTDNVMLPTARGTQVAYEIAKMENFQEDKEFAFYESADKQHVTYISNDYNKALKDSLENQLDNDKTVTIVFPIEVSHEHYSHVIMGRVIWTKPGDITQCTITVYDALTSGTFARQGEIMLADVQQKVAEIFAEKEEAVQISSSLYNMRYQLPLQTHCGRFVMTWMAAEAAGLDIKKLSNYNELFNYIFGQVEKQVKSFASTLPIVAPGQALDGFKEDLSTFLKRRQIEFNKQWTSAGKEDLELSKSLLELIDNLKKNEEIGPFRILFKNKIEALSPFLKNNIALKKIIDHGMSNLGYGSLSSFLLQAQCTDFKFSPRANIDKQYQDLAIQKERMDSMDFNDSDLDEHVEISTEEVSDEFDTLDIGGSSLANNILPAAGLGAPIKNIRGVYSEEKLNESQTDTRLMI